MLILITTVGILVFVYSDDYMSHDEGMWKGKTIDTLNVSMSHTTLKR
jgi:NADH:ubiquinone oxidoreductase subunit 5 (subunit L)/multisubunit Na+/H+ antiporter MnhA subunit